VVVLPTDTVYGLAARLDRPEAIQRIFEIKKRSHSKPLPVLVADLQQADGLGKWSPEALKAAVEWPGPLTLVLPSMRALAVLGGDGKSVALRAPNHPFALGVLRVCGPLATTSANISGENTPPGLDAIAASLGEAVDLFVDGGILNSPASRIISFVGDPRVLR